jgi:hypothetical protein
MRDKRYIAVFVGASSFIVVWMIAAAATWASRCSQPYLTHAHRALVCSNNVSNKTDLKLTIIAHRITGPKPGGNPGPQHLNRAVHLSVVFVPLLSTEHEDPTQGNRHNHLWLETSVSNICVSDRMCRLTSSVSS